MKYSTVLSLTAVFTGYVLADAPPTCTTTGDNIPIKAGCCPRDPAKRLRRSAREIFARTDAPTCETPKFYGDSCCTHEFAKPTLDKTFNLLCGANDVEDTVTDAVKVVIVGCDSADDLTKDTCILKISSTPTSSIGDTHLEISTSPWTEDNYPDQAPSKWSYTNPYCDKLTGVCQVPLNKIGGGASALCDKPLYIAYHVSTSAGKTCTGDGDIIPGQPGKRWWEYLTLDFTCSKTCDGWCCCEKPVVEPPPTETKVCDFGTAFGYAEGAKNLNGKPEGPAVCNNANRWGWYFETSATSLSGDLIVGAGGNDLKKGTTVGTWSSVKTGSDITFTYTLYDDNTNGHFDLSSVHVQASCTKPTTCAPGQFTFKDDNLSGSSDTSYTKTFAIKDGSCSTYYLIFHASVNQKIPSTDTCPTKAN